MTDLPAALSIWQALARDFTAVQVTLVDCGCYSVEFFVRGLKIIEEDKSLLVAMRQAETAARNVELIGDT
jgi:DNA-binding cell septation regulator SpoVG